MLNERNIPLEEDGIEEEIFVEEELTITKAMWGDIGGNIANQTDLQNALDAKQDSLTEAQLNAVNSGITAGKVATYDGYADQIASKADQSALNAEATTRGEADTALGTRIDNEALARQQADNGLQSQIDAITSKSDVVDVVANYAALQAYDTSTLGNNDVVKVLNDETHEDALTYYRWSTTTQTWSYIGQEAPYYSKGQMDVKLAEKQDKLTAGANIQIQNGTISATDTTYTAGNGLNLNGTEFSADTDVLATKEDLEDYYTKPETDNLLLPKLEAEVVAELPTTGEEGKLYLTPKAHETQTATGNPISLNIAEGAGSIESLKLDGDTFQQSYEGKNLFDSNNATTKNLYTTNQGVVAQSASAFAIQIEIEPNATYTISRGDGGTGGSASFFDAVPAVGLSATSRTTFGGNPSATITADSNSGYLLVYLGWQMSEEAKTAALASLQIEKGSTATSYEPYVGGTASPNPDYPQPIQTVTGLQTITINGTDYPLNLGSIELCKLGSYQDYIYKSGDDWKVHKASSKTTITNLSTITGVNSTSENTTRVNFSGVLNPIPNGLIASDRLYSKSDHFPVISNYNGDSVGIYFSNTSSGDTWFRANKTEIGTTEDSVKAWLANNPVKLYYPIPTATDTTITDTALIAQLEAIRTASLQNGANTITNTATGSNLAGDMEIGYYGFNPRNRYDKWLWLDLNNNYEQIGS